MAKNDFLQTLQFLLFSFWIIFGITDKKVYVIETLDMQLQKMTNLAQKTPND